MRRSDREVTDRNEIINIMEKCDVCRLALNDSEAPYIVPLNFGLEIEEGKIILYFHSAAKGRKLELMRMDHRASFEMDCSHRLVSSSVGCSCTMEYESVIGHGYLEQVPDEEKYRGMSILMRHYHKEELPINEAVLSQTFVYRLVVEKCTGKHRNVKTQG